MAQLHRNIKQSLSFENLAIKPDVFDSKYELIEVSESLVFVDPKSGSSGYMMEGISSCKSFDYASNRILWNPNEIYQPAHILSRFKTLYNIDID